MIVEASLPIWLVIGGNSGLMHTQRISKRVGLLLLLSLLRMAISMVQSRSVSFWGHLLVDNLMFLMLLKVP
jgi:hypothetical protein